MSKYDAHYIVSVFIKIVIKISIRRISYEKHKDPYKSKR